MIGKKIFMGGASLALYKHKCRDFRALSTASELWFQMLWGTVLLQFLFSGFLVWLSGSLWVFCPQELLQGEDIGVGVLTQLLVWPLCHLPHERSPLQGWRRAFLSAWGGTSRGEARSSPFQLWNGNRGTSSSEGQGCTPGQGVPRRWRWAGHQDEFLQPPGLKWCSWVGFVPATQIWEGGSGCSAPFSQAENPEQLLGGSLRRLSWKGTNETLEMEELLGKAEVQWHWW